MSVSHLHVAIIITQLTLLHSQITPYMYSRTNGKDNGGGSGWSDDGKVMYDDLFFRQVKQPEPDNVWEDIQPGAPENLSTTTQQR